MRRLLPRSLRAQVTVWVCALIMLVVATAGLLITFRIDHRDRQDIDRQLLARAEKVREDAGKLLSVGDQPPNGSDDDYGGLLAGSASLVRLLAGDEVLAARGERPPAAVPIPDSDGFTTIVVGGQTWRSLVAPLDSGAAQAGVRLQVMQSLDAIEQRLADNRRLAVAVALLATVVAAVGVWVVAGLVLAPLQRLRAGARQIRPGELEQRLPQVGRPQEVADLSATLNGMLERLQASMLATRRFTADAGHELRTPLTSLGVDLETLLRHPHLPEPRRQATLAAMAAQHHRIVALLDGLQALARGDAGALPEHGPVGLAELAAGVVNEARHRHPAVSFDIDLDTRSGPVVVDGWHAGLRMAVANLVDNAALHGSPQGMVQVSVRPSGTWAIVAVMDHGPGIPAGQREDMKRRFTRGQRPRADGSGLGLALVDQQAALHGGHLDLGQAPAGGLLAVLALPLAGR